MTSKQEVDKIDIEELL